MDVFLVRHGEAAVSGADGTDASRPLTKDGRAEMVEVVAGLARLDVSLDVILHSPLLRAVETAEVLSALLKRNGRTVVTAGLARTPSDALLAELTGRSMALVGHEPSIGELMSWLVTGTKPRGSSPFAFKKGGIAWLEGSPTPGEMSIVAFMPPKVTRRLGAT